VSSPDAQPKGLELRLPEQTPSEASEGQAAVAEAAAMATGADLSSRQQLYEINKLFRKDKADTHVHRILVCGVWVFAIGVFVLFGCLILNYVLPDSYRFLTDEDTRRITELLFSGFLGGLLTKGGDKLFGS
jgi:hypothetical protein